MTGADQIAEEFIDRMGLITQAEGLPRIAGRIMGFLIVHGGPFSFAELSKRLKVSRSSISTNTRLLESLGAIERIARSGDRQDYFRIHQDAYARVLEQSLKRMQHARDVVAEASSGLPSDWDGAQVRLGDLLEFYQTSIDRSQELISLLLKKKEGRGQ